MPTYVCVSCGRINESDRVQDAVRCVACGMIALPEEQVNKLIEVLTDDMRARDAESDVHEENEGGRP